MENIKIKAISSAQIIELLRALSLKALDIESEDKFIRFTLNNKLLTQMQGNLIRRDPSAGSATFAELLAIKRATVYGWAGLKTSLNFFRWTRKVAIIELTKQALLAAESNSILVTLSAMRLILEIIGNTCLLKRDFDKFAFPIDDISEKMIWLNGFDSLIDGRVAGVRSNYFKILTDGLRAAKKISYKPGDFESNLEAKDLLNGVDLLAESVKGARNAYEFFSEFAHPNLASAMTNYDQTSVRYSIDEIIFYSVHYQKDKMGDNFLENFGSVLIEGIEILSECIDEMVRLDVCLKGKADEAALVAKGVIREMVKKDPLAFDSMETCPCYSGKNIKNCCGKLIKPSKFGNWPFFRIGYKYSLH